MLFKILHGDASRISVDITPFHEGYCYVTHDGYMYIDINIGTESEPNNQRVKLNAKDAESLTGATLATIMNSSDIEIPTSKAVLDYLANYYTKTEIDDMELITVNDIDTICGGAISYAEDVKF